MMVVPETAPNLVPTADRHRWMLAFRAVLVVFIPFAVAAGVAPGPPFGRLFLISAAWLVLSVLTLPVQRLGAGAAAWAFTASLLGDGLLLGALRTSFHWLGGPIEVAVVGHIVVVTLLASFRTAVKITLWHVVVCFLVLEARGAGLLGPAVDLQVSEFAVQMSLLWMVMGVTAWFAAVNERELLRRRYDSVRLHAFGAAVGHAMPPTAIAAALAGFARDELLARRAAVLVLPESDRPPIGYALDSDGGREVRIAGYPGRHSVLHRAIAGGCSVIAAGLTVERDPALLDLLPDAHAVVVVPFRTDEASGVLVIEHPRWSSQRVSHRVELRMIDTAEQAATYAALALTGALLREQCRAGIDSGRSREEVLGHQP